MTTDQTYYVVREKSGCRSEVAEVTAEVIAQPTISITIDDEEVSVLKRCEYDEEKPLTTVLTPNESNSYVEWNIFPGNKTIQNDGSLLLSDYVTMSSTTTTSTNYTVRAQYFVKNELKGSYCPSVMDTIKVMTNAKARSVTMTNKAF